MLDAACFKCFQAKKIVWNVFKYFEVPVKKEVCFNVGQFVHLCYPYLTAVFQCFFLLYIFQALLGDYSFIFNAAVCFITSLLVYFLVPETKKRTFEEISQFFKGKNRNEESQTFALSNSEESIEYETVV